MVNLYQPSPKSFLLTPTDSISGAQVASLTFAFPLKFVPTSSVNLKNKPDDLAFSVLQVKDSLAPAKLPLSWVVVTLTPVYLSALPINL